MKNEKFQLLAKTMFGLEEVLAKEIEAQGGEEIKILNRAIGFTGTRETLYRINYFSRTALRVLKPIGGFKVTNQEELYKGVDSIDWEKYLTAEKTFSIDSVITDTGFTNSMFVSLKAKDAIADQFRNKTGVRPSVDTVNPDLRINLHIFRDTCTISLDSSGNSLHKRGYKQDASKAPMNEVLAAGLILLTGWDPETWFIDPMCGSGTIVIEAAMIGKNLPAGYFRNGFGFQKWKDFDRDLWDKITQEGEEKISSRPLKIKGSDNAKSTIRIARENLKSAGLSNDVEIRLLSFQETVPPPGLGVVLMNPPYGERLDKDEDIFGLYKSIGDTLKQKYKGYNAWIISSNMNALKQIGLRPSRKIMVYNGPLECRFLKFELYEGTKKVKQDI